MENLLKKVKDDWNSISYEVCIFLYLFLRFIVIMPTKMRSWVSTYYACNYSYGFIPRGFIGSVFNIVSKGNISSLNAHSFVFLATFILILLASILFGKLIRSIRKGPKRNMVIFLVIIYLFMPFSICYLFDKTNFGRMDLYLYIITFIQILIIYKKPTLGKMMMCMALSVVGVMIHEAYALYIFPILFVILMYVLYKNEFNKKLIVGMIFLLTAILISTIYFNFFVTTTMEDPNEFVNTLRETTDLKINDYCIKYQYYMHTAEEQKGYFVDRLIKYNVFGLICTMILLLPINMYIYKVLKEAFSKYSKTKFGYVLILMQLAVVVYIPLFACTSDWGRWLVAAYNYLVALLIIILIQNDRIVFKELIRVNKFIDKRLSKNINKFALFISIILIYSSFGVFQTAGITNIFFAFGNYIDKLI
ncbi:MAG: hypothetical protein IJX99_00700 [Clostridia bacterium]|nr:hypothetical protein [Clostridia bacterium]